ncbi:MAG: hypothetical protein HW387_1563 [Parachlamydiales bacterium]|nr:hypothetical protein [Parachlamydiales bacterium]
MFFAVWFIFAATAINSPLSLPDQLEDEELALAEKTAIVDPDEVSEDGELIFDDEEPVAELEENS